MVSKSKTPDRDIALLALQASTAFPGDMLEEVLTYCFDQLCYRRTYGELDAILKHLAALVAEDAA